LPNASNAVTLATQSRISCSLPRILEADSARHQSPRDLGPVLLTVFAARDFQFMFKVDGVIHCLFNLPNLHFLVVQHREKCVSLTALRSSE